MIFIWDERSKLVHKQDLELHEGYGQNSMDHEAKNLNSRIIELCTGFPNHLKLEKGK